ncbi:MAG: hypothetical protein AB7J34_24785 [Limisphaerales bacterium]
MPQSPTSSAKRAYAQFVEARAPVQPELPLVHTTEYERLSSIHASHRIEPRPCKVFGEPLLYLFYGRPAYRDPEKTTPIKDIAFCPVCFVFRPERHFAIKRMHPFDTGALQKGYYEPEVSRTTAFNEFAVRAVMESAQRIIAGFFETNERYMRVKPMTALAFAPEDGDAEAYHRLITGGGDPKCDDRCSAIEIQTELAADLTRDLMAVVLPTSFLEDAQFRDTLLKVWRAHPLTYDTTVGMRPSEFHGEVRKLILDFYRTWKFV